MGAVVIPINPLYTAHEMGYMLKNGDVKAVITMDVLLEKFTEIADDLPNIRHYISCETKEAFELNDPVIDRKSTRLNSSHVAISYAVFCLKKKKQNNMQ